MKNGCRWNVRKHRDIKESDNYITLDILLKFVSLDKTRIKYSEQKYKFVNIRKGVDYPSRSQGQIKAKEIQKSKVCHQKCYYEVTLKDYQGVWEIALQKLWDEDAQTWDNCQLLLPSNIACEVYDESWCPQLARFPCKNRNDWYKTDSDLANLFSKQYQIRRVPSGRKLIADLFYGRGRIKKHDLLMEFSMQKIESECAHKSVNK